MIYKKNGVFLKGKKTNPVNAMHEIGFNKGYLATVNILHFNILTH